MLTPRGLVNVSLRRPCMCRLARVDDRNRCSRRRLALAVVLLDEATARVGTRLAEPTSLSGS